MLSEVCSCEAYSLNCRVPRSSTTEISHVEINWIRSEREHKAPSHTYSHTQIDAQIHTQITGQSKEEFPAQILCFALQKKIHSIQCMCVLVFCQRSHSIAECTVGQQWRHLLTVLRLSLRERQNESFLFFIFLPWQLALRTTVCTLFIVAVALLLLLMLLFGQNSKSKRKNGLWKVFWV